MSTATSGSSFPSSGPRPLQLALQISTGLGSPAASVTPSYSSPSPHSGSPNNVSLSARIARTPRRQSSRSISYFSPNDCETRNATHARHASTKSMSLGTKSPFGAGVAGDRRSTGSVESSQSERQPHTLAEKHADLLHFIAQKESKCLDLRSQLALHETELLQLKRKWERIVNRGFERSNGINEYTSSSSPMSSNAPMQGGAMLDGIREGVQGVSRLIAAGLGELSSTSAPSPLPSPRSGMPRHSHSTQTSSSSVSTYATNTSKSARLSQSSASSLGDDSTELPSHEEENEVKVKREPETLMGSGTGATPTIGLDPVFVRNLDYGLSESRLDLGKNKSSPVTNERPTTKTDRRISKDASPLSPSAFTSKSFDLSTTPTVECPSVKRTLRAKRMSGTGLPPAVAPMGSLTGVGGNMGVQPVSSWVGSVVGKKWEEIQRGSTFTKSQKRASVLFSDMSHSIASALSAPPLASASYNPTLVPRPLSSGSGSGATSQSTTPLQSSSSLLDEDDVTVHGGLGAVMQPDLPVSVQPTPQLNASVSVKDGGGFVDDDEWGW